MTEFVTTDPSALCRALREKVGLSTGYASDLASGNRTPSLKMAVKIEDTLCIPPRWWVNRKDIPMREAA